MRVRDKEFYLRQKAYLEKLQTEHEKQPKQVRDVESLMCQELAFQEWLHTAEAKCEACNELESLYRKKWYEATKLPEPLMSKALRNAVNKSGESSRERTCSLYLHLFKCFVC